MYEPEPDKKVDAPLVLRDSGDDWWVIERANHDGRVWLERDAPNAMSLHCSARIGNADIEGTADEMRRIADAIKSQSNVSHRRCAARTTSEGVLDRKSTRLNSSHLGISYAVFCLKK